MGRDVSLGEGQRSEAFHLEKVREVKRFRKVCSELIKHVHAEQGFAEHQSLVEADLNEAVQELQDPCEDLPEELRLQLLEGESLSKGAAGTTDDLPDLVENCALVQPRVLRISAAICTGTGTGKKSGSYDSSRDTIFSLEAPLGGP